jgi:hypothetical protein
MKRQLIKSLLLFSISFLCASVHSQNRFGSIFKKITYWSSSIPTTVEVKVRGRDSLGLYNWEDKRIGIISKNDFPAFIDQARDSGLVEYEVLLSPDGDRKKETGRLYFDRILTFKSGSHKIVFKPGFFRNAYVSSELVANASRPRHVIFFHDPHWYKGKLNFALGAVQQLIKDNPGVPFKFLVEGYFEEETRAIPTGPTASILSAGFSKRYQVHQLMENFLIDVPLSYRLLYNDVSAEAIDDPLLVKWEAPWEQDKVDPALRRSDLSNRNSFVHDYLFARIRSRIQNDPGEPSQSEIDTILTAFTRNEAGVDSGVLNNLSSHLNLHNKSTFSKELSIISYLNSGNNRMAYAGGRDYVMGENINRFLSHAGDSVAIVFIGSGHENYLVNALPNDVSYSVIIPNGSNISSRNQFGKMLRIDRTDFREGTIRDMLADHMKLPVAPLVSELPAYQGYIRQIESRYNASPRNPDPEIVYDINKALEDNSGLEGGTLRYTDHATDLPEDAPPGTFCRIQLNEKKVTIYDEAGWLNNTYRIDYLRNLYFSRESGVKRSGYPCRDMNGNPKLLGFYYNNATKTLYLLESTGRPIRDFICPPGDQRCFSFLFELKFKNKKTQADA